MFVWLNADFILPWPYQTVSQRKLGSQIWDRFMRPRFPRPRAFLGFALSGSPRFYPPSPCFLLPLVSGAPRFLAALAFWDQDFLGPRAFYRSVQKIKLWKRKVKARGLWHMPLLPYGHFGIYLRSGLLVPQNPYTVVIWQPINLHHFF